MRKFTLFLVFVIFISCFNVCVFADSESEACTFSVESQEAYAGEKVVVKINVKSSGLASIKLKIDYPEELTLESVNENTELGGMFQTSPNLDIINWISLDNVSGEFTFAEMTFSVSPSAQAGSYEIKLSGDPGDIFDAEEKEIDFRIENGIVNIVAKQCGDVTGDGVIDSTDYLRVKGHFLGKYILEGYDFKAGDVTNDGEIDSTDYLRIKGHFLGSYNLYN